MSTATGMHTCVRREFRHGRYWPPCGKSAKYEYNGQWFCKNHHPPSIEVRSKAKQAVARSELVKREATWSRQQRITDAEKAVIEAAEKWTTAPENDWHTATELALAVNRLRAARE